MRRPKILRSTASAVSLAGLIAATGCRVTPSWFVADDQAGRWKLVLSRPIPGKYEDLSFPNAKDGWVTTAVGEILHTGDGGRT